MKLRKGDTVKVIAGGNSKKNNDKGKIGEILKVNAKDNTVVVEGVNIVTKHVKPRKMGEPGGLIKAESALYADKVQLICPKCGRPTRTGSKINAKGQKVRTCKKQDCGAEF